VTLDEKYMQMALWLARRGLGCVEPNPAVGAVIVKNGRIIGTGWHKKFGAQHAEINALEHCIKHRHSPKGATMYVTLEPCCHFGKTGPCTNAIIAAKLKRVVVATIDPSQHANGRGIRLLRRAGIKVDIGNCENEARVLNAPFLKFAATGQPWVTLKWAQSVDAKLAWKAKARKHRWISCEQSRNDAHNLRRQAGAILVGINTVLKDDPLLTPRPNRGKKPIRVVLDNRLRIPLDCRLLATAESGPVLILSNSRAVKKNAAKARRISQTGAKLFTFPDKTKSNLKFLLRLLAKLGTQHLLVEGGPTVIGSFLNENLADEVVVYIAPKVLGAGGDASMAGRLSTVPLYPVALKLIGSDIRINALTELGTKTAGIALVSAKVKP